VIYGTKPNVLANKDSLLLSNFGGTTHEAVQQSLTHIFHSIRGNNKREHDTD